MNNLLDYIKPLASTKNLIFSYFFLFIFSFLWGKFSGYFYERKVRKVLNHHLTISNKLVSELIDEMINEAKLKTKWENYANYSTRRFLYLLLGFISLLQLIVIMFEKSVDTISANVCILTLIISFLDFKDNGATVIRMKEEFNSEISNIGRNALDIEEMAQLDYILDYMVNKNLITANEKMEKIKELSRDKRK